MPAQAPKTAPVVVAEREPAVPKPWRRTGELLGTTPTHAIVLTEQIISVEIETGENAATVVTEAEDPSPSFERLLPRLGDTKRKTLTVDRLEDMPVYVGGNAVVFMRGADDAVTSLVGLDAVTLEQSWVVELASKRPVRSCSTDAGVMLIPPPSDPARFVDWEGNQRWLREFGDPDEEVADFACGDEDVTVVLRTSSASRLRRFRSRTGDLVDESPEVPSAPLSSTVRRTAPSDARVKQTGDEVVGHVSL